MIATVGEVTEEVDVLVVGAGPAGLFAALGLVERSSLRVLVIDAGRDIDERARESDDARSDLVTGIGGAGLFSDGKLCLSLGVGGELGAITNAPARDRLLHAVARVFGVDRLVEERDRSDAIRRPDGVDVVSYPVFHVGTEHCAERVEGVCQTVRAAGAEIRSSTRLNDLHGSLSGGFLARVIGPEHTYFISARRVVLALGKVGAHFQERQCRELGATVTAVPMYIGARLEADRAAAMPLLGASSDPKLKLYFEDGSKIKTHCAADGGDVLPIWYDELPLAGGHALSDRASGRTSVGILWNGIRLQDGSHDTAVDLMRRCSAATGGKLLAQRVSDLLARRPSRTEDIAASDPSTSFWTAGDFRKVFPAEYFDRFEIFFDLLCQQAPQLKSNRTILLGPSIEWWSSRINTDEYLQSAVPGLYVAGDGAGWSQGIVHAAATGLRVAEGITGRPFDGVVSASGLAATSSR